MNLPDVNELRGLLPYMSPSERDELHRAIFGGECDLGVLSLHELRRLRYLAGKLCAAWPYCGEDFLSATLTEMLIAFDDEEWRDFLSLERWTRGDARPPDHPFVGHRAIRELESDGYHPPAWRPDQPLREAQRILKGVTP